jgi:hypothetical protein
MPTRRRVLGVLLAAALGVSGTSIAAPVSIDAGLLPGATELRGSEILGHPVGKLAISYAELVHAGRMDDALDLATVAEQERACSQSLGQRHRSEEFKRKMLPRPPHFLSAIEQGGVLSIQGAAAFLEIVTTTRREEPDGSVTSSSTRVALPFALENGEWRVAG